MSIPSALPEDFGWVTIVKGRKQKPTIQEKPPVEAVLFKSRVSTVQTQPLLALPKDQAKSLLATMFSVAKKTDSFVQRAISRETLRAMTPKEFRQTVYFSQESVSCCINCDEENKSDVLLPLTKLTGIFNKSGFDVSKPPIDLVEMEEEGKFVALDNRRASAVYLAKDMQGDIPVRIYKRESKLSGQEIRRFSGKKDVRDGVIHLEKFQEGNLRGKDVTFQEATICRLSALNPEKIIKQPFFELPYAKPIVSSQEHRRHADAYNKRLEKLT